MRLLFVGDVMGRAGREALADYLPQVVQAYNPDMTIVNGENAANGAGITIKIAKEFFDLGVDVITLGNHAWDQRELISHIHNHANIVRPANYPPGTPGKGFYLHQVESNGLKVLVVNMMGRLFMDPLDDPFRCMEDILLHYRLGQNVDAIFVDFHAETTSEKMSFAHHFDGRISAVVGTHTHIPTADTHVLSHGTAYQTDAGMTGAYDSVIGVDKHLAAHRFVKKIPGERPRPAKGAGTLCGCVIDLKAVEGLATSIKPVRIGGVLQTTE